MFRTFVFAVLALPLSLGLVSCEEILDGESPDNPSGEQSKYVIYENLGSPNWEYLIVEDTKNLLLVNETDGEFVLAYGIFSNDTVLIIANTDKGTLEIEVNDEPFEFVCKGDSVIAYSMNGREIYSNDTLQGENANIQDVLFGKIVKDEIDKKIPDFMEKPIELIKYLYKADGESPHEKIDYILENYSKLISSDRIDELLACAEKKKDSHKSTPIYYFGIKIGTIEVKGSSAVCTTKGYLHIGNCTPVFNNNSLIYGVCYSTSSLPVDGDCNHYVLLDSTMINGSDISLQTSFILPSIKLEATTYHYRAYFCNTSTRMIQYSDEVKELTVPGICSGTNHAHAVDMGLSVKWACRNVGADSPEYTGGYYAWGETEEKDSYIADTYRFWTNEYENISGTAYDVAHVKWGEGWRMPTKEEFEELGDKCVWQDATINGVNGKVVAGPNGNAIFLPAAGLIDSSYSAEIVNWGIDGYYLSGTKGPDFNAFYLYFMTWVPLYEVSDFNFPRFLGYSIRPVTD